MPQRRDEEHREEYEGYETRRFGFPGLVNWSSIWAGVISAFAILAILGALVMAVGWASHGGTGSIVSAIIVTFVAFLVGGYVAGATSTVGSRLEGFVLGSMVWAVCAAFVLVLAALGTGSLLGTIMGTTAPAGGAPPATPVGPQQAAIGILVDLIVAYIGAVIGGVYGYSSREHVEAR